MRNKVQKIFILLILLVFSFCFSGCFLTVSQNLKNGSKLMVSSYDKLSKDYEAVKKATAVFVEKKDPASLKNLMDVEKKFFGGFQAIGIAIKSCDEAIQELTTEEEK